MSFIFRSVDKDNLSELRLIAEADSRIPLEFDPTCMFAESSIDARLEFYGQLTDDDFFEVATIEGSVVAFHIVKKTPYPPNLSIGNIISLWVLPAFRGKGLASELKKRGEEWAKKNGMVFIQTSVHKNNSRMLSINMAYAYEQAYINLRKQLSNA
jgi:GNAT superfamily N-acetyltransferase